MKQYRMYSIVLRHLSGIQKGIQHGHAKDMYEKKYGDFDEYKKWLNNDVTVVVLECHSCQQLRDAVDALEYGGVYHSIFQEPDLDNIPTAVSFLAPEDVWDFDNYPNEPFDVYVPGDLTPAKISELKYAAQYAANEMKYGVEIAFLKQFHRRYNLASN
jgi:hypothetical protein